LRRLRFNDGGAGLCCGFAMHCSGAGKLRKCSDLTPEFQQFAIEGIVLLRAQVSKLFELSTKLALSPDCING
jgi:hypothetical protein